MYISLGTVTLSACYIAVAEGVDVARIMQSVGITSGPWLNPTSGTFVVAYAIHKVRARMRPPRLTTAPAHGSDPRGHHRRRHAGHCEAAARAGPVQVLDQLEVLCGSRITRASVGLPSRRAPAQLLSW